MEQLDIFAGLKVAVANRLVLPNDFNQCFIFDLILALKGQFLKSRVACLERLRNHNHLLVGHVTLAKCEFLNCLLARQSIDIVLEA